MKPGRGGWACPLIAMLAGIVMLMRGWSTVAVFNDTVDEPFHIAAAVTLIESGRLVHGIETPPVARIVQGLALRMAGVETNTLVPSRIIHDNREAIPVGVKILAKGRVPYWRVLARRAGRHCCSQQSPCFTCTCLGA